MEMNPQRVRSAEFRTVKKGLDPDDVQLFLNAVADELERAQNQSTAMEARARAAVARLQELADDAGSQSDASAEILRPSEAVAEPDVVTASVDQSETISRTLLLAQRTADTTVAEARAEAERLRTEAEAEATQQIDSSREMAESLLVEARVEARQVGEEERAAMEGEVNSLLARRDFLESDVDHLERFLVDQRARLREAASQIVDLTERVPGGLGDVRRPLVSGASDDVAAAVETSTTTNAAPEEAPVAEPSAAAEPEPATEVEPQPVAGVEPDEEAEDLWFPNAADEPMPVIDPEEGSRSRLSFGDNAD
jgi:DivIVA domain-containing protein